MKKIILCLMILLTGIGFSQKKRCGTDELNFNRLQQNPSLIEIRKQQEVELKKSILNSSKKRLNLTIPVVVHVVYNTDLENISDEQINSQIQALNRDFNNLNSDSLRSNHAFYPLVGNLGIKFELAAIDPSGKKTTGITRTKTSKVNWIEDDLNKDNMKFTSSGGIENWDPKRYLNIYTVRFADAVQLLGYAYFPEDLASFPETDGVVIDFRCFGTKGTSGIEGFNPYNLGRTVTHEVGHWLGLFHIWGDRVVETDKECGDDQVTDTPPAEGDNSGNPTFPHRPNNKCGSDKNGEMYMNYMDYVYDKSMVMFSKGQVSRMTSSINTFRKDLFNYVPSIVKVNNIVINSPNNDSIFNKLLGTVQLSSSVLPINATNKIVKWNCAPDSIATIDQTGKLTIKRDGKVKVTAESTDGSLFLASKNLTFLTEIKVDKINLKTPNNDTVFKKSIKTFVITAEILPAYAENKTLTWTCIPDTIATIDQNGTISIIKTGVITVKAQSTDGSLVTASKVISIINDATTSLFENEKLLVLTIHPNPTSDLFYISTNSFGNGKVRIYDIVGKVWFENSFSSEQNQFNLTGLQNGNYIVEIEINGEVFRDKLIKK
jgi:uncharacterized protein YjdB